jgi:hypothetical protein
MQPINHFLFYSHKLFVRMWFEQFDKIWVLHLPNRKDRYRQTTDEFERYQIPFSWRPAFPHADPRMGLYLTMRLAFEEALQKKYESILLFEDDCQFLWDPQPVMDKALLQLPMDWDLLYLGCNLVNRPAGFYAPNLLPVSRALATHAVAYSAAAMELFVSLPVTLPVDILLAQQIQSSGHSYCICPMVVSQYPGYSDIMRQVTNWTPFLQTRFKEQVTPLLDQPGNQQCCKI